MECLEATPVTICCRWRTEEDLLNWQKRERQRTKLPAWKFRLWSYQQTDTDTDRQTHTYTQTQTDTHQMEASPDSGDVAR